MHYRSKTAEFSLIEDEILCVTFLRNDELIDLEEAKIHVEIAGKLTAGRKLPVLVDAVLSLHQLSKEASEYISEFDNKAAEAILVKELHQRLIATFYLKLVARKKDHPVKVFTDRNRAIEWLKSHK